MIYVFLANGFEEIEALATVDILRRAELDVKTVGVGGKTVTGSHGIPVTADIEEKDVTTDDMELVVLPGGMPGTNNLYADKRVTDAVRKCYDEGKYVAAICAAPSVILGGMGLLKGRKATCYPGMEDGMAGAIPLERTCVVDGRIITACGVGGALDFGCALVSALCGEEKARRIAAEVVHNVRK